MKNSANRVGVFVDVQNLYHWKCERRVPIDYTALLKFTAEQGEVTVANAYVSRNGGNGKEENFLRALALMGFRVITRPLKTLPDGTQKGNLDVEMAIDAVLSASCFDIAVLVTGDSDFAAVVDRLTHFGKRVIVIGPDESTASELILTSQRFLKASQVPGFVHTVEGIELPKAA